MLLWLIILLAALGAAFFAFQANPQLASSLMNVETGAVVEREDVLDRDLLAFHADDLGDVGDAAAPVPHTRDLHDHVDGRGDLLADRP
jgi:hypothetical protein